MMKKLLVQFIYSSILCLLAHSIAYTQPVYDNNGQAIGQAGASSATISNFSVPAGNDRLLVVCAAGTSISSITFNGNSMTEQITAASNGLNVHIFTYLLGNSGTATTGDIVVSGGNVVNVGAKSYHNVNQTTPVDNPNSNTALTAQSSSSLPVTSEANDLVCDCLNGYNTDGPYTFNENASQTQTFHNNAGTLGGIEVTIGGSQKAGAASVNMDWAISSSVFFVHLGMNLNSAGVLPVELVDFKGQATAAGNRLQWQTATEENNEGFDIQRSSDGRNWETISFVQGHGTTQEVQNYTYTDKAPLSGTNYYRLKQVDFDGAFEYSEVITITMERLNDKTVDIFPNPVSDELNIVNLSRVLGDGEGVATIYNVLGQPIREWTIDNGQWTIDVKDLPKGQYILCIAQENGNVISKQFVK